MIYKTLKLVLSKTYMSLKIGGSEKKKPHSKSSCPRFIFCKQLTILFLVSL